MSDTTLTGILIVAFGMTVAVSSGAPVMNMLGLFIGVIGLLYGLFMGAEGEVPLSDEAGDDGDASPDPTDEVAQQTEPSD